MENLVREVVEKVLAPRGIELVDLEIHSGRRTQVRVFIEKEGGVTVADCSAVARELNVHFMVEEAIPEDTLIEVSSPGMDRPFKTLRDFERNRGRPVEVRHLAGEKEALSVGVLEAAGPEGLRLLTDKGAVDIRMDSVKIARQHIPF